VEQILECALRYAFACVFVWVLGEAFAPIG
jgi:hypothetical protein